MSRKTPGTSWCRWCEDVARRDGAQCDEIERIAPILDALRALGAEVLLDVYGIDVADPVDAPLDRAVARWWRESAP